MRIARHILFLLILLAAFGIPYLLSQDDWNTSARSLWDSVWTRRATSVRALKVAAPADGPIGAIPTQVEVDSAAPPSPKVEKMVQRLRTIAERTERPLTSDTYPLVGGPPTAHPAEIFRFDVSPEWVTNHWARVVQIPAGALRQFRAPVSTGTRPLDVQGSISYYFDSERNVQRITFRGTSIDPGPLTASLAHHYQLAPRNMLGGHLHVAERSDQLHGAMWVHLASVVTTDARGRKYRIEVELNRPDLPYGTTDFLDEMASRIGLPADPSSSGDGAESNLPAAADGVSESPTNDTV